MAKMGIIKHLRATSKQTNLVAINVTDFNNANPIEAKNWFDATYVSRTPTLIVRDHGYPIYTYAGENFQTLKTLLSGKNPQTNKKFKFTNTPTINIIQNEFEKTNIKIDAYRPNNLTNVKD